MKTNGGFNMQTLCSSALKLGLAGAGLFSIFSVTHAATIDPVNNEKLAVVTVTTARPQLFARGRVPSVQLSSSRLASPMAFKLGQPQRILPSPNTTLDVQFSTGTSYRIATEVDLVAGKTYEFALPQMLVEWKKDDFGVEIGPIPRFEVTKAGDAKPFYTGYLSLPFEMQHKAGIPVVAGNFSIRQWPPADVAKPTQVSLAWGDAPVLPLTADAVQKRSHLHLVMTKAVSFPDAEYLSGCANTKPSVWAAMSISGLPAGEVRPTYDIPFNVPADIHQVRYYRNAYGTTQPLRINFGNIQKIVDIQPGTTLVENIERLEVNKVKVVREDGSQYMADATYTVQYQNQDSQWVTYTHYSQACVGYGSSMFGTPTGIYLPKGKYRVTISYKTDEGPKTQVHEVTL
jgi:hypothetical protein